MFLGGGMHFGIGETTGAAQNRGPRLRHLGTHRVLGEIW